MRRLWLLVALMVVAAPAFAADHVKLGTTRLIGYVSVPVGLRSRSFWNLATASERALS